MKPRVLPFRGALPEDFRLGFSDRGVLVGATGSGKTYAAEHLLAPFRYVAVLDPKGMIRWKGYKRYTHVRDVARAEEPRLILAPVAEELRDPACIEAWFRWLYHRENTFGYCDEVSAITPGGWIPDGYRDVLARGREKGIGFLSATQRPAYVPGHIFSESEATFIFRLRLPQDRLKMEEVTGYASEEIAALPKKVFLYRHDSREDVAGGPYRLRQG